MSFDVLIAPLTGSLGYLASADPVSLTTVSAAIFLALVAIVTGAARRDFAALGHPSVVLQLVAAVVVGFAIALANDALAGALRPEPDAAWWLAGLRRLPLYLVAAAYGPSVGVAAALLFVGFEAGAVGVDALLGPHAALLTLELAILGWLAIYPSPFVARWAAPLHAVLAYALAWGTGGLALLVAREGAVTPAGLTAQHAGTVGGVVVTAVLLATIAPARFRAAFPRSRIAPDVAPGPVARPASAPRSEVATSAPEEVGTPAASARPHAAGAAGEASEAGEATRAGAPAASSAATWWRGWDRPEIWSRGRRQAAGARRARRLDAAPGEPAGDDAHRPARPRRVPTDLTQVDLPAIEPRGDDGDSRPRKLDPVPDPE